MGRVGFAFSPHLWVELPRFDGLGFFGHTFILVVYSSSFMPRLDGGCALLLISKLCDNLDTYIRTTCGQRYHNHKIHSLHTSLLLYAL